MLTWVYNKLWGTAPVSEDKTVSETNDKPIGKISPYHPMHLLHAQMVMKTSSPALYHYRDCYNEDETMYFQQSGYELKLPIRRHKWSPKGRAFMRKGDFFHGYTFHVNYDNEVQDKKLTSNAERKFTHTEFTRKKIGKGIYIGKTTCYSIDKPDDTSNDMDNTTLFYVSRFSGEHVVTQSYHFYT